MKLCWRWGNSGVYTTKSAYKIMSEGGLIQWRLAFIWKCRIPTTVKIFTYLMLKGKILTRDVMLRRVMNYGRHCSMCNNCPTESILHVLYLCPYAVAVWFYVAQLLNRPLMSPAGTVEGIWEKSWGMVNYSGGMSRKEWASRFICTIWFIWKQCNKVVFGEQQVSAQVLAGRCFQEMRMWLSFC